MTNNNKDEMLAQGQGELPVDNNDKLQLCLDSKRLSKKKLKFTNPPSRRQYYQTKSRK
jgi:hypothetical protein